MPSTAHPPAPGSDRERGGRTAFLVLAALCVVALVAALVTTVLWLRERDEASSVRADRASAAELDAAYRDTATRVMTHLMTVRQDTLKQDVDRIVSDIEGDFAEQFTPRRDSYEEVVSMTGVAADGSVAAAAVEKSYEDHADVILAIDQTIANPKAEEGQDRQYRIRVRVNRHDDGAMKVAGVNFIP